MRHNTLQKYHSNYKVIVYLKIIILKRSREKSCEIIYLYVHVVIANDIAT